MYIIYIHKHIICRLLESGFPCVALAVIELFRPGWSQTQVSTCLCLQTADIKDTNHHIQIKLINF